MADRLPRRSARGHTRLALSTLFALAWIGLAGCARTPESQQIHDSLEPVNRPIFTANRGIDDYALGPVARGWRKITPAPVRNSISNFDYNLAFPTRFLSSLGQGEGVQASREVVRFLINSTAGVGGLFDWAGKLGLARGEEDFAQMFARWGIAPGPYLVVPLAGPSTPREVVGDVMSIALNPLTWLGVPGLDVLFLVNGRAQADDKIEAAKRASLDYYVFARDAYVQHTLSGQGGNWWDDSPIGKDELYEVQSDVDKRAEAPQQGSTDSAQ